MDDETPKLDLGSLTAEDVSPGDFVTPDPEASKPSKSRAARTPKVKPKLPPKRKGQFVQPLTELYAGMGLMVTPFDPVCGTMVMKSASQCAESIDQLAYQNDSVRRAVIALTQTSAWGAVIVAHAPIILTIMQHHASGSLPEPLRIHNEEEGEAA